jgi:BlaI family transcriptional regulator, penicillinase repressor
MSRIPKITEAEWTIMRVIWDKHPITANEVVETLSGTTNWSHKTIKTLISRLTNRGALTYEKCGRAFYFSPTVTEEASIERECESFLSRFFGGSLNPMVLYFVERGRISPEEMEELKKILHKEGEVPSPEQ